VALENIPPKGRWENAVLAIPIAIHPPPDLPAFSIAHALVAMLGTLKVDFRLSQVL
jgi:hypothetical protein